MSKSAPSPEMAERLREARTKIFPSAAAAGEALGMKAGTVRAHENGQNGIGYDDLVRYSRRYGVSLMWLITGGEDSVPVVNYDDESPDRYELTGFVQDGAWYPEEGAEGSYGPKPIGPHGEPESALYRDDRFPDDVLVAFKVRSDHPRSAYLDGSILFAVHSAYVEYRAGDHVIIVRRRNDFVEVSVREIRLLDPGAPLSEENVQLVALTSESPPLPGLHASTDAEMESIAVVVGSLTKRPVPGMSVEARREYEALVREGGTKL